jgi:CHAD domain-containing protein
MSPRDDSEVNLHEVRVALKGLRYLTELRDRVEDQDSELLLETFTAMQDRLGAWNDSIVAARFVSTLATTMQSLSSDARFAAFLLAYASARAKLVAAEHRECLRMWTRLEQAVRVAVYPDEAIKSTVTKAESGSGPPAPAPARQVTQAAG